MLPPYAEMADLSALAIASHGHTTSELIAMLIESRLYLKQTAHHGANARAHPDDHLEHLRRPVLSSRPIRARIEAQNRFRRDCPRFSTVSPVSPVEP
jgi:hypothetical protein